MNEHGKIILEYHEVLKACRSFSIVDPIEGPEDFPFFHAADELRRELVLVGIFKKMLGWQSHEIPELSLIDDIIPRFDKEGAVLELAEFGRLTILIHAYARALEWMDGQGKKLVEEEEKDALRELTTGWDKPLHFLKILSPYFNARGSFREEDIPELRSIIRRIQALNGQIQELARGLLRQDRDIWSSNELTQRDGRVVLALKSDHRGRVDGLIHGFSGSGQTLYLEPPALLEKNNALNEARSEYHLEIHRILKKCTNSLRPLALAGGLFHCQQRLLRFDSIQARAAYGRSIGSNPAMAGQAGIRLIQARHPSLGRKAVPINITLKDPTRIIVLSGPNTGGKTVALKTLGLLSLMHQSGMEIPAAGGSALPLFTDILADIGDEQSIDEGLSTFSAHLRNLNEALRHASDGSLILLDELGSGTNPTEGSALAMAILETLAERDLYALVTTHHDKLKAYAFKQPSLENASVRLSADANPTYAISMGVPGESHALDIAEKAGMAPALIARSRALMENQGQRMHGLIEDLRELKAELQQRHEESQQKERELAGREEDVRERELALREQRLIELDRFMAESRKTIEALLHKLNKLHGEQSRALAEAGTGAEADAGDPLEISALNREIRGTLKALSDQQGAAVEELHRAREAAAAASPPAALAPGMMVRYQNSGKPARIIERGRKPATWVIFAGSVKLTVPERDLEFSGEAEQGRVEYNRETTSMSRLTLDIRGKRAEEALKELERFLDQASLAGLEFFSVIHGKGTGVLQDLVHKFLEGRVESVRFAPPEDGGFGKSYVYLRE